jgi:hypothetical protein
VIYRLLDKVVDVNSQGGFYGNAQQASLDQGHNEIVQLFDGCVPDGLLMHRLVGFLIYLHRIILM